MRVARFSRGAALGFFAAVSALGRGDMLLIPAGFHRPFVRAAAPEPVAAFLLDARPVSRAGFAAFLRGNPRWAKASVKPLFAEDGYLADWGGDSPGPGDPAAPVTRVSRFAAKAYCECLGKRLPTSLEWEYAAGPGTPFAAKEQGSGAASPAGRPAARAMGRWGVWEWTADFNAPIAGFAPGGLFCGAGAAARDPDDYGGFLRYSFRGSLRADYAIKDLGFRCAKDPP